MATSTVKTTTVVTATKVETIDLTATNAEKALNKFIAAKEAIKALEAQKEEADLARREFLGEAEVGIIRGVERFRLANSSNSKIDRKALEAGWPEAYEATLVKTPYNFIKTL
jgi:predicted phage-related endonuclease